MSTQGILGNFGCPFFLCRGGLWADQALGVLGEYPFLRVLLITVPPLRRVTFFKRQKGNRKGLLLRSALAGSGSFATGSIRAQRLRFASLHLLPLCTTASYGRCAPTPESIPPLSLPTSPYRSRSKAGELTLGLLSGEKRVFGFGFVLLLPLIGTPPAQPSPEGEGADGGPVKFCVQLGLSRRRNSTKYLGQSPLPPGEG